MTPLKLILHPEPLAVCRLGADTARPKWARGRFVSVTRTAAELSIVCPVACLPPEKRRGASLKLEAPFQRLEVAGPLPFDAVGVLAELLGPLAGAGVSVFVLSTFDTDQVLVRDHEVAAAAASLRGAGMTVTRIDDPVT